jgi:hypothetical protein
MTRLPFLAMGAIAALICAVTAAPAALDPAQLRIVAFGADFLRAAAAAEVHHEPHQPHERQR